MRTKSQNPRAGFTLVELLIGISLGMAVMLGVLSSFAFLGRNLVRLVNQQTLETEARRALSFFLQDVRMSSSLSTPGTTTVTLTNPTSTGTASITYTYYTSTTTVSGVSIPAGSLTRTSPSGGTPVIMLRNLQSFKFNYYDMSDAGVTDFTNKVSSIKKLAMTFVSRTGDSTSGTLTPPYQGASPRLSLRNKPLLN